MGKLKVGLALGSGAARGLAHIGVIKALEENGIGIDVIAGTSIGAIVGGMYSAGLNVKELTDFAYRFGKKKLHFWIDPTFFKGGGLLKGEKIKEELKELGGSINFSRLKIPFYAVASNLITGEEVVISTGDLSHAIRASFAIPGLFSPIHHDGHWLIDGAVAAPIPTRILKEVGCDVIIGVNVITIPDEEDVVGSGREPKVLDVMLQVLSIAQQKLADPCMVHADIVITPDVSDYNWTNFSKVDQLIELGYEATLKELPGIKKMTSKRLKIPLINRLFKK